MMERRRRSVWPRGLPVLAVAVVAGCGFGIVDVGELDGSSGCDMECPEGTTCQRGQCLPPDAACEDIYCPRNMVCVSGTCVPSDPCAAVSCPEPGEVCQGGECVSGESDTDGDGYIAAVDCNDRDPDVHPGALEVCNGIDDDCDGQIDEGHDLDMDGFSSCGTGAPGTADCDDGRASAHPGAPEACNGLDDDCDGEVDEGVSDRPCTTACGSGVERCEDGEWVCSAPETCECSPASLVESEGCGRCGERTRTCTADLRWGPWSACLGDSGCPVVCRDGYCDPGESCETCVPDCGECTTGCPATGHLTSGENGDPCSDPPETWRCVESTRWGDWISQVCRGGVWVTFNINPRDCVACCDDYSSACAAL